MWKYNGKNYSNDWQNVHSMVVAMCADGLLEDEKTGAITLFEPYEVYRRMKENPEEFENAIKDFIIDKVTDELPREPADGETYFGAVWHKETLDGKVVITISMNGAKDYELGAIMKKAESCIDTILSGYTNIQSISSMNSTGSVTLRVSKEE